MKMAGCVLCPRACGAVRTPESGSGFCQMGTDPVVARVAPHFGEEPPLSGTRGAGAIFFSGCTLRCVYCQNGIISQQGLGKRITVRELADLFRRLMDMGVHNIDLVTPTHFTPAILEALSIYRPPVPIVWNTGGYEEISTLKLIEGSVDIYLPDLKHFSAAAGALCAHAPDYFEKASAAIKEMVRQTGPCTFDEEGIMTHGTLIRHLILPGYTTESIALLDWIKETLPEGVWVSLMRQYVPMNDVNIPGLNRRITDREYRRVRERMEALDLPGFVQEKTSADAAYTPPFTDDWE